jgi:ATP-dependent Clp protease ATP-binding subunit ClpC
MNGRAQRVFFFARFEARQFGSATIESEHLLLAVIREDAKPPGSVFPPASRIEAIREEAEKGRPPVGKIAVSSDMPLSDECKRIMKYSAEEADRLSQGQIGVGHIVVGILREEKCAAAKILNRHRLTLDDMRVRLASL